MKKSENQRFSQILIDRKTPVSLKEVKGNIANLVQYNGVLEYSLCDTHIKILPSIKKSSNKRATTAVDSHQATENQALLVSKPPSRVLLQ